MRPEVADLVRKGPLPSARHAGVAEVQAWQEAIEAVHPPLSDSEAEGLCRTLPADDDDCFGLAWAIVHLLESAPNWSAALLRRSGLRGHWARHLEQALCRRG